MIAKINSDFYIIHRCIFAQSINQPTIAPNEIHFTTGIKLLHISAPECHPQGLLEQKNISPARYGGY